MTNEVNEMSGASRGSAVMAYAVIDDEGVQHSLWFLEKDATSEAAMVGGTVVRLGHPTLTDEEREALNDAVYLCGATAGLANEQANATAWATCAATLRGLLERTK
jgi:hypothetical protein